MNEPYGVNYGAAFEAGALRVLQGVPGVTVALERPNAGDRVANALLRFGDTETRVFVEIKRRANAATAWQLVHDAAARPDGRFLLLADETTADARAILRERGIAVVDGLGNAHVELPGLLLHLQGARRAPRAAPPARLSGKAGVVAQSLLLDPERRWQVKDLASRAEVSGGLAHRVLARLEREGLMEVGGAGPKRTRRVTNTSALLDLWTEEDQPRPRRTPGFVLARSPQELLGRLATSLRGQDVPYAVTGSGAASVLAPFVTAVPVIDVWMTSLVPPNALLDAANAEPVDSGQNVVFLQANDDTGMAFRERADDIWVANRFRVYADLLRDPRRGAEQAKQLRDEVIRF